ncbi:hypothetical protein NSPZN2_30438 [Nitrospira defluvii]|uniref:Uncharacterized protein n=1 Tax=Nitrospira defluvii TaxID=330214 RepID=A0ABM8RJW0_9BACT|nr:hypothetical protein NSPZN2_30438 [Nitrospira defluvii]
MVWLNLANSQDMENFPAAYDKRNGYQSAVGYRGIGGARETLRWSGSNAQWSRDVEEAW